MREICLDIETTGLDPREGHRVIEIACVEMFNRLRTGKVFHTYINPRREVPAEAFKIHGISTEFLQDKPIFDHVAHKFLEFIKDTKLVIHNAPFDTKFLNYELGVLGIKPLVMTNVTDTLAIARTKFPGAQNSLDALCKRFNISLANRKKHGALTDTELLCDVYVELMGGNQSGLVFAEAKQETDVVVVEEKIEIVTRKAIPKRDFTLSPEELEQHKSFISQNFKNNFWGY